MRGEGDGNGGGIDVCFFGVLTHYWTLSMLVLLWARDFITPETCPIILKYQQHDA